MSKAALAKTVRKLPALSALEEIWMPRAGESDEDYFAFLAWLDAPSRGAPPAAVQKTAVRWEWSERALAYERASEIQRKLDTGNKDPGAQIIDNLTQMVLLETAKLVKRAGMSDEMVTTVKDLREIVELVRKIQREVISDDSAQVDLSVLTTDELRTFLTIQAKLKGARRK